MKAMQRKSNMRFTKEEDKKLKELVKKYGEWDWGKIAGKMENRNPRQCKDRWELYLCPYVNQSQWTPEEEELLMRLSVTMNQRWVDISKKFDRRTPSQIRNKYRTIMRRKNRSVDVCKSEFNFLQPKKIEITNDKVENPPQEKSVFDLLCFNDWNSTIDDLLDYS